MKISRTLISVCVAVSLLVGITGAAIIETVPVGDAGNLADTRYNSITIGSVGYAYNIGKYEVTAGQYTEFLNAVAATDPYGLYHTTFMWRTDYGSGITRNGSPGNYTYSVTPDFVNRPVNHVSWSDAARFTNWLHNKQPIGGQISTTTEDGAYFLNGAISDAALMAVSRKANWNWAIATEDEWYKAAFYKGGSTNAGYWNYATSSDTLPGRDLVDAAGNNANYYGAGPYPIDSPYYCTVVGEFQNSGSPYGTFDQAGNFGEWNEGVPGGTHRPARGGSFADYYGSLHASFHPYTAHPSGEGLAGFRVVEIPEPATVLLLLAVLPLLHRRRIT